MNLQEYQINAARTCPDLGDKVKNDLHMGSGMITEYGEFMDILKRELAYNKPIDKVNLAEEWADLMWYIVNQARMDNLILIIDEQFVQGNLERSQGFEKIACVIAMMEVIRDYAYDGDQESLTYLLSGWYAIAELLGIDTDKALENNIAKLKVRFPEKFNTEDALNRDLTAERKELEN